VDVVLSLTQENCVQKPIVGLKQIDFRGDQNSKLELFDLTYKLMKGRNFSGNMKDFMESNLEILWIAQQDTVQVLLSFYTQKPLLELIL
jgi:hypothetical protein